MATGGIPKAAFNAFKILHHLGDQQMAVNSTSALLTKDSADDCLVLATWNYVPPQQRGHSKAVNIQLANRDEAFQHVKIFLVDEDHGSPLKLWETMGSPAVPSLQQQADLRTAAELPPPLTLKLVKNELLLSLQPNALAVIEFTSAP